MIERLRHLYILDGSPTVYANLAREWDRRGERWCGGEALTSTHGTVGDLARYIKAIHPFNQPQFMVQCVRDSVDLYAPSRNQTGWRIHHHGIMDLLARFAIAIDGTAWAVAVTAIGEVMDFDLGEFAKCAMWSGSASSPLNQYDRTGLCRQSMRGTHNSRRQCCPLVVWQ